MPRTNLLPSPYSLPAGAGAGEGGARPATEGRPIPAGERHAAPLQNKAPPAGSPPGLAGGIWWLLGQRGAAQEAPPGLAAASETPGDGGGHAAPPFWGSLHAYWRPGTKALVHIPAGAEEQLLDDAVEGLLEELLTDAARADTAEE